MSSIYPCSKFSHIFTKIQTKKLSIRPSFYFHEVLQHLNNFIYTNFLSSKGFSVLWKRTIEFPGFCVTQYLAGSWESSFVKKHYCSFLRFCYLNIPCFRINITWIFMRWGIHAEVGKSKNRCFCWFLAALFVPLNGVNGGARNNGQWTDNVQPDWEVDRSTFLLAGHVDCLTFSRIENECID